MSANTLRAKARSSALLALWLALVQFLAAFLFALGSLALLGLDLAAFGGAHLEGAGTWGRIAAGALALLFWLAAGYLAPREVRPGPVGAAIVLPLWAAGTALLRNSYLFLLPQRLCGGALAALLSSVWPDRLAAGELGLTVSCALLPAVLGLGLYLGRKRLETRGETDEKTSQTV